MTNVTNFQDIIGAANGDKTSVLGKFLYFSLANILVEKEALAQLCEDLSIPYSGSKRISVSDAFRSATGDIKDRITVKNPGEHHIYAVYCRDNAHTEDVYSRELVKETLNQRTNQYEKLANIFYDRRDNRFGYDNLGFDADVDPISYCHRAEELFELYQFAQPPADRDDLPELSADAGGHQGQLDRASVFHPSTAHGQSGHV